MISIFGQTVGLGALIALFVIPSPGGVLADSNRGMLLYENHCVSCHDPLPHRPEEREVKDLTELRQIVTGWALHARLRWTEEDVEDVVCYLNDRHYKFPSGKTRSC